MMNPASHPSHAASLDPHTVTLDQPTTTRVFPLNMQPGDGWSRVVQTEPIIPDPPTPRPLASPEDDNYRFLITGYLVARLTFANPVSVDESVAALEVLVQYSQKLATYHLQHDCPQETVDYWQECYAWWVHELEKGPSDATTHQGPPG